MRGERKTTKRVFSAAGVAESTGRKDLFPVVNIEDYEIKGGPGGQLGVRFSISILQKFWTEAQGGQKTTPAESSHSALREGPEKRCSGRERGGHGPT